MSDRGASCDDKLSIDDLPDEVVRDTVEVFVRGRPPCRLRHLPYSSIVCRLSRELLFRRYRPLPTLGSSGVSCSFHSVGTTPFATRRDQNQKNVHKLLF